MSKKSKKKKPQSQRDFERQAAALLGKQISEQKQKMLFVVTLIACALPMLLGLRLWDKIPEVVHTGFIGSELVGGAEDTMPRAVAVFGVPGLMCVLNLIAHFQLGRAQKRGIMPPKASRLVGRWGFPVISILFCSGFILQIAGEPLSLIVYIPYVLGLLLMMLGSKMWDAKRGDWMMLMRLPDVIEQRDDLRASVYRLAGWLWIVVGLLDVTIAMLLLDFPLWTSILFFVALIVPYFYSKSLATEA